MIGIYFTICVPYLLPGYHVKDELNILHKVDGRCYKYCQPHSPTKFV